ncbi:vomeronasal type-2 receptor 1-like [Protopterus annectens]|uniref:vomeronasal type-2 receptor 1-like n=1 Tax=Protopterus annectens TaxID=7888 RepID=UPI001CF97846|nr:vomeronasal type-2 receptor 1-like [Protopterus annectens]
MINKYTSMLISVKTLTDTVFHLRHYRYALAAVFAFREINENPYVLPNITLGFKIYDCCYSEIRALEGTIFLLSKQEDQNKKSSCATRTRPSAILGAVASKSSLPVARILGVFRYPQMSYGSVHPLLSDKSQFPSFFRTVPNDKLQPVGIAQLVKYFDWKWIGILASENDLGETGSQALKRNIISSGSCVAFLENLPMYNIRWKMPYIIDIIKKSSAKVIILYSTIEPLIPLFDEISFQGITEKVWIGTTSLTISSDFSKQEILKTLNGSLGFGMRRGEIPGFKDFLYSIHPNTFPDDIFITEFWENAFGCHWPKGNSNESRLRSEIKTCTGTEKVEEINKSLFDVNNFRFTYSSYIATHSLAYALDSMLSCNFKDQLLVNVTCGSIHELLPWKEVKRLRSSKTLQEQPKEPIKQKTDGTLQVDELKSALLPLQSAIQELSGKMNSFGSSINKIADGLELAEGRSKTNEIEIERLKEELKTKDKTIYDIQAKIVDLEARSRRNNLIIRGLSEKYESHNLLETIAQIFNNLLHERSPSAKYIIERAHRALRKWQTHSIPRPIYVKMLNHQDLVHYLKKVHFITTAGHEIYFDDNGDIPTSYDILNWQMFPNGTGRYYQVGRFYTSDHPGGIIDIDDHAVWWNENTSEVPHSVCSENCPPGHRKATRQGEPICCFDCIMCSKGEIANQTGEKSCLKCSKELWSNDRREKCIQKLTEVLAYEEPLGSTLAAINCAFSVITISIFFIFMKNQETPIVRANNRELSFILLLTLMMCFLCSLIFIGNPTRLTCLLRQTAFGVVFSLAISCILAKTIIVIIAFKATQPGSNLRKWLGMRLPSSVVSGCTLIQLFICGGWMFFSPSFPESNMESGEGTITLQCNDGSVTAFWSMLGYMGLLATVSLIIAFLARNLPDNFNDAKFITFSMLVFASVWLSFIPAYLSTKGKYSVAVEVFAIMASSAGMLICIFFPKCYIILLRPDLNSKDKLMGSKMKH